MTDPRLDRLRSCYTSVLHDVMRAEAPQGRDGLLHEVQPAVAVRDQADGVRHEHIHDKGIGQTGGPVQAPGANGLRGAARSREHRRRS